MLITFDKFFINDVILVKKIKNNNKLWLGLSKLNKFSCIIN